MRIGIVSDTHDNKTKVKAIFSHMQEQGVKTVIHLGDLISPFVLDWINNTYSGRLILVRGNNDGELLFTLKKTEKYSYEYHEDPSVIELDGKKIAIMHKPTFIDLIIDKVDFILYGHTHKKEIRNTGKTIIINPGEACGYLTGEATFALLDLDTGEVKIERA